MNVIHYSDVSNWMEEAKKAGCSHLAVYEYDGHTTFAVFVMPQEECEDALKRHVDSLADRWEEDDLDEDGDHPESQFIHSDLILLMEMGD